MRSVLPLLILLYLLTGCGESFDNDAETTAPGLTFSLAPAYVSGVVVPVNAQIILHASTALNPSTVNENSVYVQNSLNERQPAYISLVDQDIVVQPKIYLTADTAFTVVVTTAVASSKGEHLSQDAVTPFVSGAASADTTGPALVETLPLDKSSNIEPYAVLYFQFSESISPLNLDPNAFQLYAAGSANSVPGTVRVSGSLISFTPDSDLIDGTNYTMELNTTTISDLAGNPFSGPATAGSNFTVNTTAATLSLAESSPGYAIGAIAYSLKSVGSTLFIGGQNGLDIITYDLTTSTFTAQAHLGTSELGTVYGIDLNSSINRAYIASSAGFSIVDITDITAPVIKSQYRTLDPELFPVPVYGLNVAAGNAYLAATTLGIIGLDISDESRPVQTFVTDTNGTAFDVEKVGNTLVVSDYDQGTKLFNPAGTSLTAPTPQAAGQDRNLFSVYNAGSGLYDYFVAAGIGGIKYWDSFNGIGLPAITTASYVSGIIETQPDGINAFANIRGVGIASFSTLSWSIQSYQRLPFDITAIGYLDYSSNIGVTGVLLAADADGILHAYEIQ